MITKNTEAFLSGDSKIALDDLLGDTRKVLIPDVRNEMWLVDLGKLYSEMVRIKKNAEKSIGILTTGVTTYLSVKPYFGCQTACVGGGEMVFYISFILSLKSSEVMFVYAHELYHTYQNVPLRIMKHAKHYYLNELKSRKVRGSSPNVNSICKWYRDNHDLINQAADYEDNFILAKTGTVTVDFLTGGDVLHPRFCYKEEYGRRKFEEIYDILRQREGRGGNDTDEDLFKPKKKVVFEDPVIIEDGDDDASTRPGSMTPDGEHHIYGKQTVKVKDASDGDDGDGAEVEFRDGYEDRRKKKPEGNSKDSGSDNPNNNSKNGEAEGSEAEGSETEGSEAEGSETEGSEAEGSEAEGSEAEGSEAEGSEAEGSEAEGSEAEGSEAEGSDDEGSEAEGSEAEGSEAEGSEAEGSEAEGSDDEGSEARGGHFTKDSAKSEAAAVKDARDAARALAEWASNATGVNTWKGGKFTGEIKGELSAKEIAMIVRLITDAISAGVREKLVASLRNGVDTIISTQKKTSHWGNRNHIWKKEVRPYSKSKNADAMINLVLMFDNSGSMGAPLICSCIDCILDIWKDYEDTISKVVLIPMRQMFFHDKNDYYIITELENASSAKAQIAANAGTDNEESFNNAVAILTDRRIIDPDEYNVFLNIGDRRWATGSEGVTRICKTILRIISRQNLSMSDMFTSLFISPDPGCDKLSSVFDKYHVNTIPYRME